MAVQILSSCLGKKTKLNLNSFEEVKALLCMELFTQKSN